MEYDQEFCLLRRPCASVGSILCVKKRSELPPGQRNYKGRSVFEGSFVSGQRSNVAVFGEFASSMALISASKMIDIPGGQADWAMLQSVAQQADTQSEVKGAEAWLFLSRDQWPTWSSYDWLSAGILRRSSSGKGKESHRAVSVTWVRAGS